MRLGQSFAGTLRGVPPLREWLQVLWLPAFGGPCGTNSYQLWLAVGHSRSQPAKSKKLWRRATYLENDICRTSAFTSCFWKACQLSAFRFISSYLGEFQANFGLVAYHRFRRRSDDWVPTLGMKHVQSSSACLMFIETQRRWVPSQIRQGVDRIQPRLRTAAESENMSCAELFARPSCPAHVNCKGFLVC